MDVLIKFLGLFLKAFRPSKIQPDIPPVVDNEITTKPVVDNISPDTRHKDMKNQSFMKTTIVLRRGSIENSSGQIGEMVTETGEHICYACEDVSRLPALKDDHSNFDEIAWMCNPDNPDQTKVYGETAISAGLYKVGVRHDRGRAEDERRRYFKKGDWHNLGIMELIDVPGFKYIQCHPGNYPKDTHGCPLIGDWDGKTVMVSRSRINYKPFYERYAPIADAGDLWIRIEDVQRRKPLSFD